MSRARAEELAVSLQGSCPGACSLGSDLVPFQSSLGCRQPVAFYGHPDWWPWMLLLTCPDVPPVAWSPELCVHPLLPATAVVLAGAGGDRVRVPPSSWTLPSPVDPRLLCFFVSRVLLLFELAHLSLALKCEEVSSNCISDLKMIESKVSGRRCGCPAPARGDGTQGAEGVAVAGPPPGGCTCHWQVFFTCALRSGDAISAILQNVSFHFPVVIDAGPCRHQVFI